MDLVAHGGLVRPSAVETDSCRELVKRVLASSQFNRSLRLQKFLSYVCEAALQDRLEDINEQRIGERVFGRPESYNAAEDNIVRSQARILRQKLEVYFANEGAFEPILLRIPKGGYVPEFVERIPTAPEALVEIRRPAAGNRVVAGLTFAVAILSVTVVALSWSALRIRGASVRAQSTAPREVKALWSQLFSERAPTVVVVPDSTFYMKQEVSGNQLDLDSYLGRPDLEDNPGVRQLEQLLPRFSSRRYTTFDAISTAIRVVQLAEKFPSKVVIRYARDVTLHDLSPGNLILIGRPSSNLWEELFRSKLNFRARLDNHHATWLNAAPRPDEEAEYVPKLERDHYNAYGSVAFLPNINGGNVLIIGGSNSNSQEGAAQFATEENLLRAFAQKIQLKGETLPYFDALLRITTVGDVSEQPSLVAYRLLSR